MAKLSEKSMSADAVFAASTCYLPLTYNSLALLKKGVIPLFTLPAPALPWLTVSEQQDSVAIGEEEYQQYLQLAYQRLPANVAGLLTFAQFVQQAAVKRAQIEDELRQRRMTSMPPSMPQEWFIQRLFSDPYSVPAWQQSGLGFASIWLAIDEQAWPQVAPQPVQYGVAPSSSWPQRLYYDPERNRHLAERRVSVTRSQAHRIVRIQDQEWALLRLPPNAIRGVLFGSALSDVWQAQFVQFWRSDFRYQRVPLLSMLWENGELHWSDGALRG